VERFGTSVAEGCSTSAAFSLLFLFEFLITFLWAPKYKK
jgi:hypothetical protein